MQMPWTVERRNALLEQAWVLFSKADLTGLHDLLVSVPEEEIFRQPELGLYLCDAWFYLGERDQGRDLLLKLAEPLKRTGNSALFRRQMNREIHARIYFGELAEAEQVAEALMQAAFDADDEGTVASAFVALGVVADIRCNWSLAISSFLRALTPFQRSGLRRGIGGIHHNLGMSYRQLGAYAESETHFDLAVQNYKAVGVEADIAGTEMERALLLNTLGDHRLAEALARSALRRYSSVQHRPGIGDANRVLGILAGSRGRFSEAREHLQFSLQVAYEVGDRLVQAETHEELAYLEERCGNANLVSDLVHKATALYSAMGAERRAERLRERLGVAVAG